MVSGPTTGSDPAEDELRRRYAAGEIDDEEYQRRRAELRKR
jgi:putative membrane protein